MRITWILAAVVLLATTGAGGFESAGATSVAGTAAPGRFAPAPPPSGPARSDWSAPVTVAPPGGLPSPYSQGNGGLSCADPSFCMAVGGNAFSGAASAVYDDGTWGVPQLIGAGVDIRDVSCISRTWCVAVGSDKDGPWAATYDGSSWTGGGISGGGILTRVSCASPTMCLALGKWYQTPTTALVYDGQTWTSAPLNAGKVVSVSCASATFCMVINEKSRAFVYDGSRWSRPTRIDPVPVTSLSCASATSCVAVDRAGDDVIFNGTGWSDPAPIDSRVLDSVSCAAPSACVAIDGAGAALTYDGTSWSKHGPVIHPPHGTRVGVSCSVSVCVAMTSSGYAAARDAGVWHRRQLIFAGWHGPRSVSCVSSSFCVVVDGMLAITYRDGVWQPPEIVDPDAPMESVSCPTATFCMAVDTHGHALSYDGTTWSAPTLVDKGDGAIDAVSCATPTFCVAVDKTAHALVYDGTSWSEPEQVDANGFPLTAVSCVSSSFCMAVDQHTFSQMFDGTSWSQISIYPSDLYVTVSCTSATFCVAGGDSLWRWDGNHWGLTKWAHRSRAVSCATRTFCAQVQGKFGDVYDGTQWAPRKRLGWTDPTDPDGTLAFPSSISCPTSRFCMAINAFGEAITYTS
jgi:hypothetical protein